MAILPLEGSGACMRGPGKPGGKQKAVSRSSPFEVRDTFEPSAESERSARLASIRQKVKSGFYNSGDVADDLSDSFAKVFDQLL